MKIVIVSSKSWTECFSLAYKEIDTAGVQDVKELVSERYGIDHWEKINLDEYRVTFADDKKMAYWMLRWS